jgi:hypothetical protein
MNASHAVSGTVLAIAVLAIAWTPVSTRQSAKPRVDFEALPYAPQHLVCYRATSPMHIDGALDEPSWRTATWSRPFVDIQGDGHPAPLHRTRVEMLWDDKALYIAADLDEPDLWATLTARDSVIFHDNDFEVFIDPDGDTHNYGELEVNALGTAWDLLLARPYRDGGPPANGWDIHGLEVGVTRRGTLNHPGDRDDGWTVELALPWTSLEDLTADHQPPRAGDHWRVNFSRVEWRLDARDGVYAKRTAADDRTTLPEDNWVWSPQGAVDMHMPERWGVVQFSSLAAGPSGPSGPSGPTGSGQGDVFVDDPNDAVKWALRRLYYRERQYRADHGRYTADAASLGAGAIHVDGAPLEARIEATSTQYTISAPGAGGATVRIGDDGRVWVERAVAGRNWPR